MAAGGYTDCACRDCFDVAISDSDDALGLCGDCAEAGCDETGQSECMRDDAYGGGDEPAEGDWVTSDHINFYEQGGTGKLLFSVDPDEDMEAAIEREMQRQGYFPDVWWISDHGNPHRIDLTGKK